MLKLGTVAQFEKLKGKLPPEVRQEVRGLVQMLDNEYGADREIDNADGGFVLVAETVEDVAELCRDYVDIAACQPEEVNILQPGGKFVNALYLMGNEFGINVIIPLDLAPEELRKGVLDNGTV